MQDLIDRNSLIADIEEEMEYGDSSNEIRKFENALINKGLAVALKRIRLQPTQYPNIMNAPDWIPCADLMPIDSQDILIYDRYKDMYTAWYSTVTGKFYISESDSWVRKDAVTHWMPVPIPPREYREHGKWVKTCSCGVDEICCSICGHKTNIHINRTQESGYCYFDAYCGRCGAIMDGGESDA